MRYKKELGQHFLTDKKAITALIKAAQINRGDTIVEVGAGTGALTKPLARKAKKVLAVEIDRELVPKLQKNLGKIKNVEIINSDILSFLDKDPFSQSILGPSSLKVVGAIPYQITSPLIHKLLKLERKPKSITIIVQKEVAEKMVAKAPKGSYLGNFVDNFGEGEIIETIGPEAFRPQPGVDSSILKITLYPKEIVPDQEFEKFLHRGFSQPRKMLNKIFPADILKKSKINPQRRPQTLSFEEWKKLFPLAKETL
jgi:16S rRNA (adenine1518-N6/adenine1519-N6)-dimethyltransferase